MLDPQIQTAIIQAGRTFMKGYHIDDPYEDSFESDQDCKLPQPPLVKAPVTPKSEHISLPLTFDALDLQNDLISLIKDRRSSRVYTQEEMTLEQLSFLLWATQGIKSIRGKAYATLRTVPCGGARHEFETYLIIRKVSGLQPGAYHYLPMEHSLEFLHEIPEIGDVISQTLCGQTWAAKANVVFYWTLDAYRVEWRYGIYAHRAALIDVGHIGQNLYLACTGLHLGTCGIASFSHELCCNLFHLDGDNDFVVYTAPVGTIKEDLVAENLFYQFVEDQNL